MVKHLAKVLSVERRSNNKSHSIKIGMYIMHIGLEKYLLSKYSQTEDNAIA